MYKTKKIFGAKKVVIVLQKYHLYRSLYIAKKMGLDAYGFRQTLDIIQKNNIIEARNGLQGLKVVYKMYRKTD